MVALARKTLVYEWRRYLPASLAVAFAGLLVQVQAALILGIFATASIYVSASSADLWVGFPGTQSVELGRPIPAATEMHLRLDPAVARVEPVRRIEGDWRGPIERGGVSVFVTGIDVRDDGMMFTRTIPTSLRHLLIEPGALLVDEADLDKLGLAIGQRAEFNGHRVRIVGALRGLRALGGVNLVGSLETARALDPASEADGGVSYYVVRLRDGVALDVARARLAAQPGTPRFEVWTREGFARRAIVFWLLDTGAGLGFLFGAAIVLLVGAVIASQTLIAAIAGMARELATLRALGVGVPKLRRVVLAQSAWVGIAGAVIGATLGAALLAIADAERVPVYTGTMSTAACAGLMLFVALLSGWYAAGALHRADPAVLLR